MRWWCLSWGEGHRESRSTAASAWAGQDEDGCEEGKGAGKTGRGFEQQACVVVVGVGAFAICPAQCHSRQRTGSHLFTAVLEWGRGS